MAWGLLLIIVLMTGALINAMQFCLSALEGKVSSVLISLGATVAYGMLIVHYWSQG